MELCMLWDTMIGIHEALWELGIFMLGVLRVNVLRILGLSLHIEKRGVIWAVARIASKVRGSKWIDLSRAGVFSIVGEPSRINVQNIS
jgi:hypothetical protein